MWSYRLCCIALVLVACAKYSNGDLPGSDEPVPLSTQEGEVPRHGRYLLASPDLVWRSGEGDIARRQKTMHLHDAWPSHGAVSPQPKFRPSFLAL